MTLEEAVEIGSASLHYCISLHDFMVEAQAGVKLAPGDQLLLCTDGLYSEVARHRLKALLGTDGQSLADRSQRLFDEAVANGGNTTFQWC